MEDQKKPKDTEAMILQAAEKEFLEKGYAGARTTAIAEAAGVTHAMLHYYFRTKDKLFEKIVSDKMEKLCEMLLMAINHPELPLKERVQKGIEGHFEFLRANPDLPRFIINELAEHPERMETLRGTLLKNATSLLESLQEEIDRLASCNRCERVDARMLLIDMVSLNVFLFLAAPMVKTVAGSIYGDYDLFLEMRKRENVKTILGKLKLEL